MSIASWAVSHRRSILFLLAILAVGGVAAGLGLPVALFPHVDFPRIVVSLDAGDRPAEQMVMQVTRPAEEAVRALPGVRRVRSTTSRGSAELSITFAWGRDMPLALLEVESAVNQAAASMPQGTSFTARRMDPTVYPVAAYSLTSTTLDPVALRDVAEYQLRPVLSTVEGVARVGVQGGEEAEYRVDVDPAQLAAYGLSMQDVISALSAANVLQAVGRLEDRYELFLVLSDTRLKSLDEIRHTVLESGENGLVDLDDIADVRRGHAPSWQTVKAHGRPAVLLNVYQQPGGNTVKIVQGVKAELDRMRAKLPKGVRIGNWYDQSRLITASAGSVRDAILIGVGLAALILLLFLRSLKLMAVAVLIVPIVLATTVLLLFVLGMSFNIMTLGGMAAAVGLVIDDDIVMLEHIVRRLRGTGGDHVSRMRTAVREFARPLMGSSASTVVIFLPLAFLTGVTGAFFKSLALTMASALVISFFVAWLAVPLVADRLLTEADAAREDRGRVTQAAHRAYRRLMALLLRRPLWLLAGVLPLVLLGWLAWRGVGSGFMPAIDEGGFVLDYRAAAGTSLTETDRLLDQVAAILSSTPEVDTWSRRTGLQLGGGITEVNEGDYFIRLKPPPRRPIEEVMDEVRRRIEEEVPGLTIETAQLMEDLIGDLTAVPQPIEVKLFGDEPKVLLETAPKIAAVVSKLPGVVEVRDGIVLAGDALDVVVDRSKAALEGVDPEAVTHQLDALLSGVVTTEVQRGIKLVGIRVWIPETLRTRISQVAGLRLRAADGHRFPLGRIATVRTLTGQPQITREDLAPMIAVTGRVSGTDMGSAVAEVKRALARPGLVPKGVSWRLGGLYREQQTAFRGLMAVFGAAVALVFVLLLFLYERFRVAFSILAMPLLAVAAVFIGLWLTGIELNITAMMGMTMVVGIVTEVAIFYFSEYQDLLEEGLDPDAALVDAGVNRMRPIAMTTLAAVLALLPLALALGQGAAMQQPLAVAIISGLLVQLPLVLVVMPVLFQRLHRRAAR